VQYIGDSWGTVPPNWRIIFFVGLLRENRTLCSHSATIVSRPPAGMSLRARREGSRERFASRPSTRGVPNSVLF